MRNGLYSLIYNQLRRSSANPADANFRGKEPATMNQNRSAFIRLTGQHVGRTALVLLPLGCAMFGLGQPAAQAQTQVPACVAALDELTSRWQAIGFSEPSKPSQMIVVGANGYRTTGGQYIYMRQQIRVAARDCEQGRDAEALQHIDTVESALHITPSHMYAQDAHTVR